MSTLDELLEEGFALEASDIHLCAEMPPVFRIHGRLVRHGDIHFSAKELESVLVAVIPEPKQAEFRAKGEVDFSYAISGVGRFRVNIYMQRGSTAGAFRFIPYQITPLRDLTVSSGVPEVLEMLCDKPNGLVLLTGPTGSGKSTTLAGMIDFVNNTRDCHIITLEDPIEFLHRHKRSVINQREVGNDTTSFARGLRAALREDPDVILVGEMRDLETIQIALEAAETGHLVLATVHTNSAPATVDRLIDVFPPEQQGQVRVQVASTLQGVITQRLFKRRDAKGRFGACEVLVVTPATRNLIREAKTHQILSVIQTGGRLGMRTMEASVKEIYDRGIISLEDYQAFQAEQESLGISSNRGGTQGGMTGAAGVGQGMGGVQGYGTATGMNRPTGSR